MTALTADNVAGVTADHTTLVELTPEFFDAASLWLSQPGINRWLTSEWRDRPVTSVVVAMAVRNKRNRLFIIKHGDEACGLAALADIDTGDKTAMAWYLLGQRGLGGRGITTRALQQLKHIAFEELGLCSLYAWVMEDNVPSRRVLEKAGFREAGRIRHATASAGRQVDRIYFDIIPDVQ